MIAKLIYSRLQRHGIKVFMDIDLRAGQNFVEEITNNIKSSDAIVAIVSNNSIHSDFITLELEAVSELGIPIFPIFYDVDLSTLPPPVRDRHGIQLSSDKPTEIEKVIAHIVSVLLRAKEQKTNPAALSEFADRVSEAKAKELRQLGNNETDSNSVFVVHGRDESALNEVEVYLKSIGINPVIMTRMGGDDTSLMQRFFKHANEANFAVVLITGDDYGSFCDQYHADGVGEKSLQFRARQNVILELGFFYGKLGWEDVFVLYKPPSKIFPNFERPSDLEGVIFNNMSNANWKELLKTRLYKKRKAVCANHGASTSL
ncbi:nucleotide-binding protein [Rhodomicrobium sp. Az07]|uniref:TIR domain-containing protein n=1 Tax=Rhodomicrobium sp. Az07 TaxID=2839034 RepID=UPI001BE9E8D5|nr:TIR domain-containing protein [Rhodomicrobium sp. Az07]MBT3072016.1 nucleotide-binding protein [Rhodomicrobium sp. Az07]